MFTVKPSATTTAAAALLLLLMVAAAAPSVESADCTSPYRTCRVAVSSPGLARERCCDLLDKVDCYCEVIRRIRADGLDYKAVWCLSGATCPQTQSSLRGGSVDPSSSTS
ncbi:hypothetical protein ACUV84_017443 [Puccinellia chinampoensis]